jgi:hypothetical protein
MKTNLIRPILTIPLKILTIALGLLLIPIACIAGLILPWRAVLSFLLFILPLTLLILWAVTRLACRKLDRKISPVSFYLVIIVGAIFWLSFVGISVDLYLQRIPLKKMIWNVTAMANDMAKIEYEEPASPNPFDDKHQELQK